MTSKRMIPPSPRTLVAGLLHKAFFAFFIVLILNAPADAAETLPRTIVERFQGDLLAVMKEAETLGVRGRYRRLAPVIENSFHIPLMIRWASAPYWKGAGEDRQNRLRAAFLRMSIATLATLFDGYSGQTFVFVGESPGPQRRTRIVETRIVDPDQSFVAIDYVARKVGDRWFIVDVLVDKGISELTVRRSEYRKVLRDKGIDGLIATLEAKAGQLLME